ncbi:MAG TPA: polyphosphate kinase 2 family protein [Actinomycetota bacterium]
MPVRPMRDRLRIDPDGGRSFATVDPRSTPGVGKRGTAEKRMIRRQDRLRKLQDRLFAERRRALLVVLQGTDTSGKDGTVKHVIGAVNPQGVEITSFKAPTPEELRHHFLWRIRRRLPEPGHIAIFNRSHYEDVLVARVRELAPPEVIERRYREINEFERKVVESGTTIVKLCLHISAKEQGKRLLARLDDPEKRWKFNPGDLDDRDRWNEFQAAYATAVARCSTEWAPWYVVPADRKWYRNVAVTDILVDTLREMDPRYPEPDLDIPALRERLSKPPAGGG